LTIEKRICIIPLQKQDQDQDACSKIRTVLLTWVQWIRICDLTISARRVLYMSTFNIWWLHRTKGFSYYLIHFTSLSFINIIQYPVMIDNDFMELIRLVSKSFFAVEYFCDSFKSLWQVLLRVSQNSSLILMVMPQK
jgi:hypothetical protein